MLAGVQRTKNSQITEGNSRLFIIKLCESV